MADPTLTDFLVDLLVDEKLAKAFNKDKAKVLKDRKLDQGIVDKINADDKDGLKEMIGGQQGGGGGGRAKEADRLARKAAALAKKAESLAKKAASLAKTR